MYEEALGRPAFLFFFFEEEEEEVVVVVACSLSCLGRFLYALMILERSKPS